MGRYEHGFHDGIATYQKHHDSIWLIMDKMIKLDHFLLVKISYGIEDHDKGYIFELVSLHGVPLSIMLDRGPQLISHFWKSFQRGFGTKVKLSIIFHPQTDRQDKRTIQTFEDMLRVYVLEFNGN